MQSHGARPGPTARVCERFSAFGHCNRVGCPYVHSHAPPEPFHWAPTAAPPVPVPRTHGPSSTAPDGIIGPAPAPTRTQVPPHPESVTSGGSTIAQRPSLSELDAGRARSPTGESLPRPARPAPAYRAPNEPACPPPYHGTPNTLAPVPGPGPVIKPVLKTVTVSKIAPVPKFGRAAPSAAPTVHRAEEAIEALFDIIPEGRAVIMSQLGMKFHEIHAGGWEANFRHLGPLGKFIQSQSCYFTVRPAGPGTLAVSRATEEEAAHAVSLSKCSPVEVAEGDGQESRAVTLQGEASAEEAIAALQAALRGKTLPLPQVATALGVGGWKQRYPHLGSLKQFVAKHTDHFVVEGYKGKEGLDKGQVTLRCTGAPVVTPPTLVATPPTPVAPHSTHQGRGKGLNKGTAEEALAALLAVVSDDPLPLPQVAAAFGPGRWRDRYSHLGALISFVGAHQQHFIVDPNRAMGQVTVQRRPSCLGTARAGVARPPVLARKRLAPNGNQPPTKRSHMSVPEHAGLDDEGRPPPPEYYDMDEGSPPDYSESLGF